MSRKGEGKHREEATQFNDVCEISTRIRPTRDLQPKTSLREMLNSRALIYDILISGIKSKISFMSKITTLHYVLIKLL